MGLGTLKKSQLQPIRPNFIPPTLPTILRLFIPILHILITLREPLQQNLPQFIRFGLVITAQVIPLIPIRMSL